MEPRPRGSGSDAEQHLLSTDHSVLAGDDLHLFYPVEESEEFE